MIREYLKVAESTIADGELRIHPALVRVDRHVMAYLTLVDCDKKIVTRFLGQRTQRTRRDPC